jgi:hypothetical protein
MSRKQFNTSKVFEDLEAYKAFCAEFGYTFDLGTLYQNNDRIWRLYSQRYMADKPVRNMWEIDGQNYKNRVNKTKKY